MHLPRNNSATHWSLNMTRPGSRSVKWSIITARFFAPVLAHVVLYCPSAFLSICLMTASRACCRKTFCCSFVWSHVISGSHSLRYLARDWTDEIVRPAGGEIFSWSTVAFNAFKPCGGGVSPGDERGDTVFEGILRKCKKVNRSLRMNNRICPYQVERDGPAVFNTSVTSHLM